MKYIFLILLIPLSVFSQDEDCETNSPNDSISVVTQLAIPNCNNRDLVRKAKSGQTTDLCITCKSKFERMTSKNIPMKSDSENQKIFFETSINEYKKLVTDNLISAVRLMALRPTGSDFKKSTQACQMKTHDDFLKGCSSNKAKEFLRNSPLLKDLIKETPRELAQILSNENSQMAGTLLKRNPSSCHIPERQLLLIGSSIVEESFSPELIDYFKSLPADKFSNTAELFSSEDFVNRFGDLSELSNSISAHPFLSQIFKSPQKASLFFRNLSSPSSYHKLQNSLYSKSSGDDFDSSLAESCTKSFEKLKASICSNDFENGNLSIDSFKNHSKLYSSELSPTRDEFATSEDVLKKNEYLLSLCENTKSNPKNLSECTDAISISLADKYKVQNFEEFKADKFTSEIGSLNEAICSLNNSSCTGDNIHTFQCRAFLKYKQMQDSNTIESRLASSSNKEGNALLRAMIGDVSKADLDPKTKEILVLNGIIPKDDGTMVAQAEIPERRPDYFTNPQTQVAAQRAAAGSTVQSSDAAKASMARPRSQQAGMNEQYKVMQPQSAPSSDLAAYDSESAELDQIKADIMDRLRRLPDSPPMTQPRAQALAQQAYKGRGITPTTAQLNALSNRLMAPAPSSVANNAVVNDQPRNEVASSDTQTAAEKYRADGMNRALADMAGARAVTAAEAASANGRAPASTSDDNKPLTNVALNISNDPRVSLSQLFADKLNTNDPETQLLKVLVGSKKNFLLTVRGVNFRVVFDENKKMNLLLDSGNQEEAQRLRPQLEVFFRRLNSN